MAWQGIEGHDGVVPDPGEGRQRARRAGRTGRHRGYQRHRGVTGKNPDQFLTGESGGAGDGDAGD